MHSVKEEVEPWNNSQTYFKRSNLTRRKEWKSEFSNVITSVTTNLFTCVRRLSGSLLFRIPEFQNYSRTALWVLRVVRIILSVEIKYYSNDRGRHVPRKKTNASATFITPPFYSFILIKYSCIIYIQHYWNNAYSLNL